MSERDPIRAGDLTEIVTVRRRVSTPTTPPAATVAWPAVEGCIDLPAQVIWLNGTERMQAMAVGSQVTCRVRLRYTDTVAAITEADRLEHDGTTLQIAAVLRFPRDARIELLAAELR